MKFLGQLSRIGVELRIEEINVCHKINAIAVEGFVFQQLSSRLANIISRSDDFQFPVTFFLRLIF